MKSENLSRRMILKSGLVACAGICSLEAIAKGAEEMKKAIEAKKEIPVGASIYPSVPAKTGKEKFNLGMASYTFRKFSTEQALAMTKRLGLKYISFKDVHMPLNSTSEQIQNTAAKVKEAGITLYACGVIYMKSEADVQQAFDYAKTVGVKMIVGVPNYELLGLVEKKAKEYDIKVAVHNHGADYPLYPSPAIVYEKVKDLDKRIGLCIDIGHAQRSGIDPSEAAEKFADRLLDLHIKDESAATTEGTTVEMGRGVIDLVKLMRTLEKIGYTGVAAFEYEKDENDPLAGVAESAGYTRGILASI
jgi:inosose dehydratase